MKHSRTIVSRLDRRRIKRLIFDAPVTKVSIWARRVALFALILAVIGVATIRFGAVEVPAGLAILTAALIFALLVVPLTVAAMVVIWRTGRRGSRIALSGLFLSMAILVYPGWLAWKARQLPFLHDVSTDVTDAPVFSRSAEALAARASRTPGDVKKTTRAAQQKAYPEVQPILVDLDAEDTFDLVAKTATGLGWKIVDQTPPGGRMGLGHVDAVARSLVMGFPEDVTIRITPLTSQTRIDLRSVSRYGGHDIGANAARIMAFAAALTADPTAK